MTDQTFRVTVMSQVTGSGTSVLLVPRFDPDRVGGDAAATYTELATAFRDTNSGILIAEDALAERFADVDGETLHGDDIFDRVYSAVGPSL